MIINGTPLLIDSPIARMEIEKKTAHGTSYGLSEVGYDIRIKQTIKFMPYTIKPHAKVIDNGVHEIFDGRFVLASAMDEFQMPENLAGIVHDKSTWARRGLSVFNTVIEPGWRGFLTLELVYHGQEPLTIHAGSGIAQVIFHRVTVPARYMGKYQDQADKPVSAIHA